MSEVKKCVHCQKEVVPWERETECNQCEEGYEEREREFGEGSDFKRCRSCYGTNSFKFMETNFCDDMCVEEYFDNQNN